MGGWGWEVQPPQSLRATAGSEVATFGLTEEQVGTELAFGTLALLFLMALPPPYTHGAGNDYEMHLAGLNRHPALK